MKRLALIAAVFVTHAGAFADFTGITCEEFVGEEWLANGYADAGVTTYRIYANYDDVDDHHLQVFGEDPNCFSATPTGGVFHNPPFGGYTAPLDLTGIGIWGNQWDTYVTIGKTTSVGDATSTSPGFIDSVEEMAGTYLTYYGGYFITPDDEQGRPIDGRVFILQLVVPEGDTVTGNLNIYSIVNGAAQEFTFLSFACGVADCNANGIPDSVEIETGQSNDCDGNGVPDKCDEEPCLRADLDCSGVVGFQDIIRILGEWGPCGLCPADIDDDGRVAFSDLLYILSHHGPCTP